MFEARANFAKISKIKEKEDDSGTKHYYVKANNYIGFKFTGDSGFKYTITREMFVILHGIKIAETRLDVSNPEDPILCVIDREKERSNESGQSCVIKLLNLNPLSTEEIPWNF